MEKAPGPVTARAVFIGLAGSIALNLMMGYNDGYLGNTPLTGNHFPVAAIIYVGVLVLAVNAGLRRATGRPGLAPGELILVWAMLAVSGSIGSAGLMRYFPPWMAAPAYYASSNQNYASYILPRIPDWMVLSREPGDLAVKWYMEGLPRGKTILWSAWLPPMAAWFGFILLLYAAVFALVSLFCRHWSENERLVFPIVRLPVEIAAAPAPGRLLNAFLANPLTWVGAAIPACIHSLNALSAWFPALPRIRLGWWLGSIVADRPWSEFQLMGLTVYFIVIGLTFLLTTQVAFSFWFFYVLYRLSFVMVAWMGASGGYWSDWTNRTTVFGVAGVQVVLAGFLLWYARGHLKKWLGRVVSGERDPVLDPLPPRLAFGLAAGAAAGMAAWFVAAGAQWWVAPLAVAIFLAGMLVTTRVVAESGLLFVNNNVVPYDAITGLLPSQALTAKSAVVLMMQKSVVMADAREILMPHVMHGLKAGDQTATGGGRLAPSPAAGLLGVLALTAVVAVGVSAYGRIATGYKYGGVNQEQWSHVWQPHSYMDTLHRYLEQPPRYEWVKVLDRDALPVNAAHAGTWAALAGVLLALQSRLLWWPLSPIGLVTCAAWSTSVIWFSIFLGWMAKALVMGAGGAAAYRRVLPFFLGMVLGEAMAAGFWLSVSLILGRPGLPILPG
jgi:hypothetical protein